MKLDQGIENRNFWSRLLVMEYLIFEVTALIELNFYAKTLVLQQIHYEEPIEI